MTNIFVLPLTQKAPFTKGCLLAVNGYLLAMFNISDSDLLAGAEVTLELLSCLDCVASGGMC